MANRVPDMIRGRETNISGTLLDMMKDSINTGFNLGGKEKQPDQNHLLKISTYGCQPNNNGKKTPPNRPFVHRVSIINHPFWVPLFLETSI